MPDLFHHDQSWPFGALRQNQYRTILADPPWQFELRSPAGEQKSPQQHYACMTLDAIQALPVWELAADHCVLVLWATPPMLPQALRTMAAWRFTFKSAGVWAKQSSTGASWTFGTGYYYRSAAELWLLGTKGQPSAMAHDVRNLIVAPVREHSRKPEQMRRDLEGLFLGPRCELFARQATPGWDAWGLQTDRFQPSAEEAV